MHRDYFLWCTRCLTWGINEWILLILAFPTLNFGVKAVMKTSVLLTWDLPPNYKPQAPFKVSTSQVDGHCWHEVQKRLNMNWVCTDKILAVQFKLKNAGLKKKQQLLFYFNNMFWHAVQPFVIWKSNIRCWHLSQYDWVTFCICTKTMKIPIHARLWGVIICQSDISIPTQMIGEQRQFKV